MTRQGAVLYLLLERTGGLSGFTAVAPHVPCQNPAFRSPTPASPHLYTEYVHPSTTDLPRLPA